MDDEQHLTPPTPTGRRFDLPALAALLACLALALALRLPGLTVFLTADEARSWFGRVIIFFDSLLRADWANTGPGGEVGYLENVSLSPAPGVTTMWSGTTGIFLEYLHQGLPGSLTEFLRQVPFDPLDPAMLLTLRLPGVLVAVAAVGLTYWWSRPLLGRWGALLAAAFLALDPFYLALTRVLGHDALVATFMWLSLLAFLRATVPNRTSYVKTESENQTTNPSALPQPREASLIFHPSREAFILLSGACAGLAFLSKYPALFIGAFIALTMLIIYVVQALAAPSSSTTPRSTLHTPRSTLYAPALKRWLRDMVLWSIAAAVVFVIFWPAMWVDPVGTVTTIINDALRASGGSHPKGSFFLGQPVPDPGALFYPIVILFRTTPVTFFGFLVAIWLLLRQTFQKTVTDKTNHAPRSTLYTTSLILLAYIILYTLLVTYGGKKQDRYILPAFPAIMMLAAIGYLYLLSLTLPALHFAWILPVVLMLLQLVMVWPYFPYYFSYYNPLAGGGRAAARLIQVGWGEGLNEAAAYLNTRSNIESTRATSWYSTTFEPYFRGQAIYKIEDEKISRSAKPGLAADYVIFYLNQVQRQLPSAGVLQYFRASSPVYTVTLNGIDYAWIYPSAGMQHVIAGEARLVGQAELLGYNLADEQGRPVTAAYPESVVFLSLFWEWQGKAEAEPIRISLIDSAGQTRGYGNPIETVAPYPYDEWQEGMVVRDEFALVIFPDTPPGDYRLAAWIDRPATGETVGVFPLGEAESIPVIPRPPQ